MVQEYVIGAGTTCGVEQLTWAKALWLGKNKTTESNAEKTNSFFN